jgi:anti-anti-sigma factor
MTSRPIEHEQPPLLVKPEGEMTIYQAVPLKETLLAALREADSVDLDLSGVSEIDSAGLQLLLLAKRESLRSGKTLRVVSHSAATLDVIDTCNLAAYFGDPVLISD